MLRSVMAVPVAVAVTVTASGCGASSDSHELATLTIETRDPSPNRVAVSTSREVAAGRVRIALRNRGDMLHDAQLFRVPAARTADDVETVLESADSAPKPRWLQPAGGVAATRPGETATVVEVLEPGVYYVADTQERADPSGAKLTNATKQGIARIEVTGDGAGELPTTRATIAAHDYGFDTAGIVAGRNRVTFRNDGRELHQAVAFALPRGRSAAAGRRAVLRRQDETGWVPVATSHHRATAVLDSDGALVGEMSFRPGRYLLLCFVADRAGGPPHWTKGMEAELNVEERPR